MFVSTACALTEYPFSPSWVVAAGGWWIVEEPDGT